MSPSLPPAWPARAGRAALLAAGVAFLVHLGALANGFALDDELVLVSDPSLRSLEALGPRLLEPYWPGSYGGDVGSWRPLTTSVFGLTWMVSGGAPWAFHLVALLLHAGASALVVLVAARLVAPATAALAGLLFAVHPVHVEAVANGVGLAEPLAALGVLGALLLHLHGGETSGPGRVVGVALLYALAILAKEGAVVLPALVLLVDAARRELRPGDLPDYLRRRGALHLGMAAVLALSLAARSQVLGGVTGAVHPRGAAVLEEIPRIWTLATVWPHYLRLLLLPADLAADYGPGVIPVAWGWTVAGVLGVAVALTALAGAWVAWRRGGLLGAGRDTPRVYALAVVWVGIALLPVSNVLFLGPVLLAERTLYLASVGAVVGLAAGAGLLADRAPRLTAVMVAAGLAALAARSADRVPAWRDSRTVAATLLEEHPESGWAWWAWSRQLADEGQGKEARRALAPALLLLDSEPQISLDAGSMLLASGHLGPARFFFERVRRERPGWYSAAALLAAVELQEGRPGSALPHARAAVELAPGNPSMHHLLARSLAATGRWDEAVEARRASLDGGFAALWRSWGSFSRELAAAGDTAGALAALDSARLRASDARVGDSLDAVARSLDPTRPED